MQPSRQAEKPAQHPVTQSVSAVAQRPLQSAHCAASQDSQVVPGVKVHPSASSQRSVVQLMASLHASGAPLVHVPPRHWSPVVQALASEQAVPSGFGAETQAPLAGSQRAFMHGPEAGQTTGLPPRQVPDWQVSVVVQAFWSSQAVPFAFAG